MASLNYTVDSHPVRFPVVHAVLGAGGHVVYEDPKLGTSWGVVAELAAPAKAGLAAAAGPAAAPAAAPVAEAPAPVAEAPAPVADAPAPVAEAPAPIAEAPAAKPTKKGASL